MASFTPFVALHQAPRKNSRFIAPRITRAVFQYSRSTPRAWTVRPPKLRRQRAYTNANPLSSRLSLGFYRKTSGTRERPPSKDKQDRFYFVSRPNQPTSPASSPRINAAVRVFLIPHGNFDPPAAIRATRMQMRPGPDAFPIRR